MPRKQHYAAMRLEKGEIEALPPLAIPIANELKLPDGCEGFLFVFTTKTAARKYYDKNIGLVELFIKKTDE